MATHDAILRVEGDRATSLVSRKQFGGDSIATLLEDRAGTVWVGTSNGVWRWRDSVTRVLHRPNGGYIALTEAPRAPEVWVGTLDRVSRIDIAETPRVTELWATDRGYAAHRQVFPDRSGRMHWVANRWILRDARAPDATRAAYDTVADLRAQTSAATFDHEGSLWVGMAAAGLHRLKPRFEQVLSASN